MPLTDLQAALQRNGLEGALAYLNAAVPHRYTAAYRLEGDMLRNIGLYDKRHEVPAAALKEVPLVDSFCQFALRDGAFSSADTAHDARLDGHPCQGIVLSYTGVPVMLRGRLWGTLCHFDTCPWDIGDAQFEQLQQAGQQLQGYVTAL